MHHPAPGFGAVICCALLCLLSGRTTSAAVNFTFVTVNNPGNTLDPTTNAGAVPYAYQISAHEVTNAQYAEFLTAKAASDPTGLFDPQMESDASGGIGRSGASGGFMYTVKPGQENTPVNWVSWRDSARFVNWLHNGRGAGSTENGVYNMSLAVPTRSAVATYALPTDDEWYKAAYHQPAAAGGDADDYWLYPTRTNDTPNSDQPPGAAGIASNVANFFRDDGLANGFNDGYAATGNVVLDDVNHLTDVGAYTGAPSFYGTFDQGGNTSEWTEGILFGFAGLRGGGYSTASDFLRSDTGSAGSPDGSFTDIGFRVVLIPEPAPAAVVLIVAVICLLAPTRWRTSAASCYGGRAVTLVNAGRLM